MGQPLVRRLALVAAASWLLLGAARLDAAIAVTGRVEDEDGRPLVATLRLAPLVGMRRAAELHRDGGWPPPALAESKSGSDGEFALEAPAPGVYRLIATAPSRAAREMLLAPLVEPTRLPPAVLAAEAPLALAVTDPRGRPAAGALVIAGAGEGRSGGAGWGPHAVRAVTDAQGRARISVAAADRLDLWVAAPGFAVARRRDAGGGSVRVALEAGVPRRVSVAAPGGRPAAGALVLHADSGLPLGATAADGSLQLTVAGPDPLPLWVEDAAGNAGAGSASAAVPGQKPTPVTVALAAPVRLAGRVIDLETRRPVGGAVVWLGGDPAGFAASDAGGGYVLQEPAAGRATYVSISAAAAGYFPQAHPRTEPGVAPTLALKPGAAIAGTVTDARGGPLAGVEVTASSNVGGRRGGFDTRPDVRARSDARGRFRLAPLTVDSPARVVFRRSGFAPLVERVPRVAAGAPTELHVTLRPGARGRGLVVDASRQPVAGASVRLTSQEEAPSPRVRFLPMAGAPAPTGEGATDGGGRFVLADLPAGKFVLQVEAPGFAPTTVPGIEVPEGAAEVDLGTIALVAGAAVEGRVVDDRGQPVAGAEVLVVEGGAAMMLRFVRGRTTPEATTGADGFFRIADRQPGAKVDLAAYKSGYTVGSLAGVTAPTAEPVVIALAAAVSLRGRVVDDGGEPVPNAMVAASLERSGGGLGFMGMVGRATTGSDGRFVLADVDPGTLTLHAQAVGFLPLERGGFEVPRGRDLDGIELVLRAGAAVAGTVTGPDGQPVAGALVEVAESETGFSMRGAPGASTDGDGRYRLAGVEPGERTIEVQHGRFARGVASLDVRSGENRLDLRLEGGHEVSGRVSGPAGEPVGGATVALTRGPGGGGGRRATTDAAGLFTLEAVPDGVYEVVADHPDHAQGRLPQPITVAGGPVGGLAIELPAGGSITGALTGLAFTELPRVSVVAYQQERGGKEGTVDYAGRYRVGGLAPGEWTVVAAVEAAGKRATGRLRLEPGGGEQTLDLDFGGGITLSGTVRHAGRPVDGAFVGVRGRDVAASGTARTDAAGAFRVESLEPGSYGVDVVDMQSGLRHADSVTLDGDREIEIELRERRLTGSVVDAATGEPVGGARLTLEASPEGPAAPMRFAGGAHSDDRGRFAVGVPAGGTWRLVAEKEGYARAQLVVDGTADGEEVEVRLQPAQGLTLRVARQLGAPPARVVAGVVDAAGRVVAAGSFATGEDGLVRLETVPAGTWEVVVRADDSGTVRATVVSPGPPITLVLSPSAALEVRVPDLLDDSAIAQLTLTDEAGRRLLLPGWSRVESSFELRRGRTELHFLPPGEWALQATAPDGRTWSGRAVTVAGGRAAVDLR